MRLPLHSHWATLRDMATIQIGVRLDEELLGRVDAFLDVLAERAPGLPIKRADALRVLLTRGLDAEGVKAPASPKRKSKAKT